MEGEEMAVWAFVFLYALACVRSNPNKPLKWEKKIVFHYEK